jgi:hypothetical protein
VAIYDRRCPDKTSWFISGFLALPTSWYPDIIVIAGEIIYTEGHRNQ